MSKHLELYDDFNKLDKDALRDLISKVITTAEDVAFSYDITEDMTERIKEDLDEFDIRSRVVEEEI